MSKDWHLCILIAIITLPICLLTRWIGKVGPIAQSVEQRTFNPWVDGSSPSGPTACNLIGSLSFFKEERKCRPYYGTSTKV
jgi:hypothetical protein